MRTGSVYLPGAIGPFWHLGLSGLHMGIGPPSKADIRGVATVREAPTTPTTTIIHRTARFMGVLSPGRLRWGRGNLTRCILWQVTKVMGKKLPGFRQYREYCIYLFCFHVFAELYVRRKKAWFWFLPVTKLEIGPGRNVNPFRASSAGGLPRISLQ